MSNASVPYLCRLSDLTPEPIDWLWPGYLAAGKLALIDGDPSRGKSLLTLDLAARLTTGRALPDGHVPAGPQSVVLLGGEDDVKDTVIPRLRAAGADLGRVHIYGIAEDGAQTGPPTLPDDCGLVRDMLRATAARLLIADPLFAFLSRGALNDAAIRQALAPLARVAEETHAAVLMSRHLTKGAGKQAIYRGSGSIALIGLARTAFLVARAPDDPQLQVLACTKSNLAAPPPALGYRIHHTADNQPILEWTGPVPVSANDLVLEPHRPKGDAMPQAIAFLEQLLHAGPVPAEEVYRQARAAGIADTTLFRAKGQLGVKSNQQHCDDRRLWFWSLHADAPAHSPEEAHRRFLDHFWNGETNSPQRHKEHKEDTEI